MPYRLSRVIYVLSGAGAKSMRAVSDYRSRTLSVKNKMLKAFKDSRRIRGAGTAKGGGAAAAEPDSPPAARILLLRRRWGAPCCCCSSRGAGVDERAAG